MKTILISKMNPIPIFKENEYFENFNFDLSF